MWKLAHRPKHISCGAQSPVAGSWVSFGISVPPFLQDQTPCRKGGPSAHVFLPFSVPEGWLISFSPDSTCWNPLATDKTTLMHTSCCLQLFSDTCSLGAPSTFKVLFFNYSYLFTSKGFVKTIFLLLSHNYLWLNSLVTVTWCVWGLSHSIRYSLQPLAQLLISQLPAFLALVFPWHFPKRR